MRILKQGMIVLAKASSNLTDQPRAQSDFNQY
jgi:hypothetical protein